MRTEAPATRPAPIPAPMPETVVITEQEVLLGSAVAGGLIAQPAPGWLATFRRIFASSSEPRTRVKRPSYPPRCPYLESSRMSREMRRL
jgi:hypothetical protein